MIHGREYLPALWVLAFVGECPSDTRAKDVAIAVGIDEATARTYLSRLAG